MRSSRRIVVAGLLMLLAGGGASAYLRIHTSTGVPVRWKLATLSFVVQAAGSDDVGDTSDDLAVRAAFAAWSAAEGLPLSFVEDDSSDERARTDWPSDDLHSVIFDEDGDALLFPEGSGILAVTPLQYVVSTGRIVDADIVLNGRDTHFSTTPTAGSFDVRAIVTHEVGHLLGLNHSAQGCATMTPFATPGFVLPRTLAPDDLAGVSALGGDVVGGRIAGSVARAVSGAPVSGAHVWARSSADGRIASAAITDGSGAFVLSALAPGSYALAVAPLDGPLGAASLSDGTGLPPFETDFLPAPASAFAWTVSGDETVSAAPLLVDDDASLRITGPFTARVVHPGEAIPLVLSVKSWVEPGSVSVVGGNGQLVVGDVTFVPAQGKLVLELEASREALPGAYDVVVVSAAGGVAVAAGVVEVAPPLPEPTSLQPTCGPSVGGALLTLAGTRFGGVIEATLGGVPVEALAVDGDDTLLLVTPPTAGGMLDLVLLTSAGEELRIPEAYEALPSVVPQIASVFPAVGNSAGGTKVVLLGAGFDAETRVTIGDVEVSAVSVDTTRLEFVTPALAAGSHLVRVAHAGCAAIADELPGGFVALAGDDPVLIDASPASVAHTGGELVTLLGAGFVEGTTVELGASLLDGSGGLAVPTEFVGADSLRIVTPALPLGTTSVLARLPDGRVAILAGGLAVVALLDDKDRLLGQLDAAQEDVAWIDLVAGTTLRASLHRRAPGELQPVLALRAPGGATLVSTDVDDPAHQPTLASSTAVRATLAGVVVTETGRHELVLRGVGASSGAYRLSLREKLPESSKSLVLPAGGAPAPGVAGSAFGFEVKAGSRLSGKLVGKGGLQIFVMSLVGPDGTLLQGDAAGVPTGAQEFVDAVARSPDGTRLSFAKLPLAAFGAYTLTVGAVSGTDGSLGGKLTLRAPKGKLVLVE